ncbi:Protein-associating with the carboxyl-terminal domain of ezrin [Entomortierella beljakovae]|nr:Protein-associating with the carboxyl-terminal domain of ezrin [Entomortierella beljakovae]
MGATESKSQGNGAIAGEGSSKVKLTFVQGTQPLYRTPLYSLSDALYGKRSVSAFTYDPSQFTLDNNQEFLPKAIKKLKTIRHPSVLKFIDCKPSSAGVHLVTERVIPLSIDYLESCSEDEILVGLFDIMVALHFLHSQCHISHNNVQLGSIFVSNGRWVLGGMEFTGTVEESMQVGLTSLLSEELVPPEHRGQLSKMNSRELDLAHAVDIWQYGKLVETLIEDGLLHIKPNDLPLSQMVGSDPRKRPSGDIIMESALFTRNNTVSVVRYCRLKGLDKSQNAEWSQTIVSRLQLLPSPIMENIVLPQLLTQEFFAAEGFDVLYRTLFTPQPPRPLISEEIYRSQVMPFMVKLWTYRQADIRMTILRLIEVYLKAVVLGEGGPEVLGQIILPEILAGLQDSDSKVYMASLCGLATAIPYALLVTTFADVDLTKQKHPVKSLYEQTLIPQIMAFWISEDCTQEAKIQLVEVVMGMWCSIYTLGLQNHLSVKDISSTLTLTLVSVLKLSSATERMELISKSFTKHCTNGLFCISGLLKFLPQFLLDEDQHVREAAAKAISAVAHQTTTLVTPSESAAEQQENLHPGTADVDANGRPITPSSPSNQSAHVSRIRQYCEKQQSLLPSRRPIFSRSAFTGERSASVGSLRTYNESDIKASGSTYDLHSSRRSSIVSQDSFMYSEQGSHKTPSMLTPSLTPSGSFSADPLNKDLFNTITTQDLQSRKSLEKPKQPVNHIEETSTNLNGSSIDDTALYEETTEEDTQKDDEAELLKALEAAKEEMRQRQIAANKLAVANKPESTTLGSGLKTNGSKIASSSFSWDDDGDDGGDGDDWNNDDTTILNTPSNHSPSLVSAEDELTRQEREKEKLEKQEQLRLKRDQKQQEMQAKREARRLQMAEKQVQKMASSSTLKLGATRTGASSAASTAPPTPTTTSTLPSAPVEPKPTSGVNRIQAPQGQGEEKDEWDMDGDIDIGIDKQGGSVEDELFSDMGVAYKAPAYVGPTGSTTSVSSSTSSSMTLSNSAATTLKSPVASKFTTISSSTTTLASNNSMSLKSAGSQSRGSSPASTPKRIASPLLGTTSNGSHNSIHNGSNGSEVTTSLTSTGRTSPAFLKKSGSFTTTTTTTTTTTSTTSINKSSASISSKSSATTIPSLAPQADEGGAEDDGWGDDWE